MKLSHTDNLYLQAAMGWLGLRLPAEAAKELDQISPAQQEHPEVLVVRFQMFENTRQWDRALAVAQQMTTLRPRVSWGRFHAAFCLHELKRTQEAYDTLAPIADKFPKEWLIRYNLACYSCQLGRPDEARLWLDKARALAGKADIRQMALEDRDLEPLWEEIRRVE